jgi:hypothetical protein
MDLNSKSPTLVAVQTESPPARAALANIEGLEVDYSQPLDLIVVAPLG